MPRKKKEFPIEVRHGSVTVRIYHTPHGGYDGYTVDSHYNGKRERFKRSTLKAAMTKADEVAKKIANGEAATIKLAAHEVQLIERMREQSKTLGRSLEGFVDDCLEGATILGKSATMTESARFYFKKNCVVIKAKKISEIADELIAEKKRDGVSERYIVRLNYALKKFKADFDSPLSEISGNDINSWLGKMDLGPVTRNGIRATIGVLVSFAKLRGYAPKDWNELDCIAKARVLPGEITIFSPEELSKILGASDREKQLPFVLLGAFAGVRHAEIKRLTWENIKWDSGYIEISAAAAKRVRGVTRRLIPITPNLMEWLLPYRKHRGPICIRATMEDQIETVVKESGVIWKKNALRHSFISYRMAIVKSAAQVALEAGNSPKIIFSNYRELVTEAEAKKWFSITPTLEIVTNPSPETSDTAVSSGN